MYAYHKPTFAKILPSLYQFPMGESKDAFFQYVGEVTADGKPNGYGEWKSYGETLGGMWYKGIPIAPYLSREAEGGGVFKAIRIAYATCSANDIDTRNIKPKWLTQMNDQGLNDLCIGVVEVEACISGTFYKEYPVVNFLDKSVPPFISLSFAEVLSLLLTPYNVFQINAFPDHEKLDLKTDISMILQKHVNHLDTKSQNQLIDESMRQYESADDEDFDERKEDISMEKKLYVSIDEVILFIPGFNSCLKNSIANLGQLLMLGGFPEQIFPFLFCFPMGKNFNIYIFFHLLFFCIFHVYVRSHHILS